jgi:hypothetical protein
MIIEKVAYKGWSNCLHVSNGSVELIILQQGYFFT